MKEDFAPAASEQLTDFDPETKQTNPYTLIVSFGARNPHALSCPLAGLV